MGEALDDFLDDMERAEYNPEGIEMICQNDFDTYPEPVEDTTVGDMADDICDGPWDFEAEAEQALADSEEVHIEFIEIVGETAKAWAIMIKGKKVWFPKSECKIAKVLKLPRWLANRKGL